MSSHIAAARLVDYHDRLLPDPERDEVEKHLDGCPRCRSEVSSLRKLDDQVRPHVPGNEADPPAGAATWNLEMPAGLAAAIEGRACELLDAGVPAMAAGRSRTAARRWWIAAAMASAAAVLAIAWPVAGPGVPAGLASRVVFGDGPDGLRAGGDPSFHFLVTPGASGWLCILEVSDAGVAGLFPHPNAVFGDFSLSGPFAAGLELRIPPDPILDYPAQSSDRTALFVVIPLDERPTPAVRDALAAALSKSLEGSAPREEAVRAWSDSLRPSGLLIRCQAPN